MTRDRRCELRAIVVRSEVILSVYIITFLIGLPANILALYAFIIKIHKKPTPTDILLLNLIVSDLIFLLFLPLKMHEAAFGMVWTLPSPLCNITLFVVFSFIYTSSLLLTVVSVDRYLCVAFPVPCRLRRKLLYGVVSSLVVSVSSSVHLCFIYIVENQTSSDLYICYDNFTQEQLKVVLPMRLELCVVLYIVPLLACVFCYLNFILILNRTPNLRSEKRKRAVGMAIGTLLVFVVCFLPYNVTHVHGFIIQDNVEGRLYTLHLTTVNTVLAPMTFYFSSSMFQATMKRILTGK
ncbi:free fatty acid receptor 2-like [Oncorhynchus kisutch]|uniref:free fatty acid receptor 2-like n=1 Tax=Oncorhynchus kisutch TaxID=8019 RepID=UPI0009A06FDB|nr:free fatty acid receptor 2-like [Oncorhynchus kisutch]